MLTPWSAQADFYQIFFWQQFPCHCIGCMFFQCALYWRALLTRFVILYAGGYFSNKRAIANPVYLNYALKQVPCSAMNLLIIITKKNVWSKNKYVFSTN